MIINLTGEPFRLYQPDAPDVITDDQLNAGCIVFPATATTAYVNLHHLGAGPQTFHEGRPQRTQLVRPSVCDLPPSRPHTYLLVDAVVGLCVRGRADLLIGFDHVNDSAGAVAGYRHLVSPC
ncbi:MAG: hypothetical protein HOZ81_23715 [Streptomyces sp.]|nr:hypothetical protein [Streptomyces sp.]